MSKVVSLRLKDDQIERLGRAARQLGRTPSETAALLLEESLRQREFPFIEFRDTVVGRQAYLKGTRLAAWQLARLAQLYEGDLARFAADFEIPSVALAGAMEYADAYSSEMEAAIEDDAYAAAHLSELIPNLEVFKVDAAAP